MKTIRCWLGSAMVAGHGVLGLVSAAEVPAGRVQDVPEPLRPWVGWATWDDRTRDCPTPYDDAKKVMAHWPSRLVMQVDGAGARWVLGVMVYAETWIRLPGGSEVWPVEVQANGVAVPVVEHGGAPAVKLAAGLHELQGAYRWQEMPQRIAVPAEIGVLSLSLAGKAVDTPVWDAQGFVWLRRDGSTEEVDKDSLAVKVDSVIEDGIPLWLRSDVELTVSGKSREEQIGVVLPAGWKLSAVSGPLPVAVDATGHLKAQVRAGKWVVRLEAFRHDDPREIGYAKEAKAAVAEQMIAFQARPEFRLVEVMGIPSVDVTQTTFPEKWRKLPVYRWETAVPFQLEERMRGMGLQKPAGLNITREWWLDEDGRGMSFRDRITGTQQRIWRLDVADGQDLGSVRADGEGQLITKNPGNGAPGVEVRSREIDLEATGRMDGGGKLAATGWQADAAAVDVTLNLPPGWRLFALFGADWVQGDWLTAWTLLDLFLLLIFTLAVFRLWGWKAAVLAFCAFGLAYHEPGAPRYVWLALLLPLALLRVVTKGWGKHLLLAWKWVTVLVLVILIVPFLARQVQQSIYPQLENTGRLGGQRMVESIVCYSAAAPARESRVDFLPGSAKQEADAFVDESVNSKGLFEQSANLRYDSSAVIQVGRGVPDWSWRTASFGWNGPVKAGQRVHPLLVPVGIERVLSVLRVILLVTLGGVLLNARRIGPCFRRGGTAATAACVALCCLVAAPRAGAQLPDAKMLETLRQRMNEASDAYPTAADIPALAVSLQERKLTMDVEVHAAIRTAVPLPGRLPAWSPVSVTVDGQAEPVLRRDDGFLWLVLPAGVHKVKVEGALVNLTEWECSFRLKPRRVTVEAPGWTVSGVRPDGTPEGQLFFSRQRKAAAGEASYDQPDLQTAAAVDRHLELGLRWQVRTTVSRLSPPGKAIELRVPLLPGENVITSNLVVKEGRIEVRLGAQEKEFTWQSELKPVASLALASRRDDTWVERWHLVASPVWNVGLSGVAPVFEGDGGDLVPVWRVWPGERVDLTIKQPEAVAGPTVMVGSGKQEIVLGKRQRTSTLTLSVRCSIGKDFTVSLPAGSETSSLTLGGKPVPVREDGGKLVIPLQPGEQEVVVAWKNDESLGFVARAGAVELPVESANVTTIMQVPANRWVLWAAGPLRGPAVRFWTILVCSLLAAWVLGRLAGSPLRVLEWMLLAIGLTQVPLSLALVVVGWLFFLVWRGRESFLRLPSWAHNLLQVALILITLGALGVFIGVVAAGLLGSPEMFISGNGSTNHWLRWYEARCGNVLPRPGCVSVSIWWYRFLMLAWALWLAASLIRWLRWAWRQFSTGACFRSMLPEKKVGPPPLTPG